MKKIMKKVLSLALTLIMVIALAPMTANAEEQTLSVTSGSATIESYDYEEISFKAPGNGVVKVSLAGTPGWNYQFNHPASYYSSDWIYSDAADSNNLTYDVSAGEMYVIALYGYDPATGNDMAEANVIYDIQFTGEVVEGADEPTGKTQYDPIPLEGTTAFGTATAGAMTYFKVTVDSTKDYTVNIQDRFGSTYSLYYVHPMMGYEMWLADAENGAVTTTIEAGLSEYVFAIYNNSLLDASLMFTLTEGIVEEEKPTLVVGENSVPVVVEGYFCSGTEVVFTAPESNTYVINPAADEEYADVYAMYSEYDVTWIETYPYEFTLAEGESLSFLVCTMDYMYDYKEDTVELVISVKEETETVTGTGTQDDPYTMIIGDNTAVLEVDDDEKYFIYTATEAGALYLTMLSDTWFYDGFVNEDSDPFLNFNMSYNTTSNDSGDEDPISLRTLYLEAGDVVKLRIRNAKNADWTRPAGTVVFNAWFNTGEVEGGGDVVLDEYVVDYDTMLQLGENNVELDSTAYTTIFEFCPDEVGTYKFETAEGILLGYWGAGSFFVSDYTEDKTNTLTYDITAVGQSIMLGVTGEGSCTITVTKDGEYVDDTIRHDWVNLFLEDVKDFELSEDAEMAYIDVTDGIDDVTYLGEDGYIHLNSETGPIVYAQVGWNSPYIALPELLGYQGIATSYFDEELGKTVILDFTNATIEYVGAFDGNGNYTEPLIESVNGFVPLTGDLMLIIMAAAEGQMWFEPDMNNFYFDEGTEFDSEPWLFICAYEVDPENDPYDTPDVGGDEDNKDDNTGNEDDKDDNTGNEDDKNDNTANEDNKDDDTIKNTGDATVTFITMIVFLGAALIIAGFASKKRFAK